MPKEHFKILFFGIFSSIFLSAVGQEIKIDSVYVGNSKIELKNSIEWTYEKGDTLHFFIVKKEPSELTDYKRDTFSFVVENVSNLGNKFEVLFGGKDNKPVFSFEFNNNFIGKRRVIRSFRYDMNKTNIKDVVSRISIVTKESEGAIRFILPLLHTARSQKRIKTNYNNGVKGFYSDTTYHYYYNKSIDDHSQEKSTDEYDYLKKRYLDIIYGYIPGVDCNTEPKIKTVKEDVINRLKDLLKNNKILTPENVGLDISLISKALHYNNGQNSKRSVEIISQIIEQVFYNGFSDNTQDLYGQHKIREYFQSLLLTYPYLNDKAQNLVKKTLKWHLKINSILEENPRVEPTTSDLIRNRYFYMLGYILVIEKNKSLYLSKFSDHLSFLLLSSNFNSWLKRDGSTFHHKSHNIPYAYSLNDLKLILEILNGTKYELEEQELNKFADAVISTFVMSKNNYYTNNISGRHPFDTENPVCLKSLESLLHFNIDNEKKKLVKKILEDGNNLEGFWAFNYSNLAIYKKNNFHIAAKGFSKIFWGSEIYKEENRYGRYQGYGTLDIIGNEGFEKSGFSHKGWDWNRPPGSTTIILPWETLEPSKSRVDEYSEKNFAGALSYGEIDELEVRKAGVFGFDFEEKLSSSHHNTSFNFKKSYHFFDDFVVALGSNINADTDEYEVNTNILQKKSFVSSKLYVNDILIKQNDSLSFKNETHGNLIISGAKESYILFDYNELVISLSNQGSYLDDKTEYNYDIFYNARINHGKSPKNNGYEYMILLKELDYSGFRKNYNLLQEKPYMVLQKDKKAHIIHINRAKRFNYVIFEPYLSRLENDVLLSTSLSALVSAKINETVVEVSVAVPSIKFNKDNGVKEEEILLKFKGKYKVRNNEKIDVSYDLDNNTIVKLLCSEGRESHFKLENY
ncbi:hypothetical protein GCM10009430_07260 [Aquimarina litoralis]|uniref:Uncharacterized protein n=1 Tax=Aquimarina litoralis TaxID=584605 RepID=A0ABN1II64_9FLAO